jgi:hypothetical protein
MSSELLTTPLQDRDDRIEHDIIGEIGMMGSAQVFDIEELNEERAEFRGKQKAILLIL